MELSSIQVRYTNFHKHLDILKCSGGPKMKRTIFTTVFLCCAAPWSLFGDSIVLGTDNGGNGDPFSGPFAGFQGTEYQEAYASSDFSFSGPAIITGIDFFLEPGFSGTTLYGATYKLSLSIVTANINNLSDTNLASNLGTDNTVFTTVALAGTAPDELTFGGSPFSYDPSLGNLLLDIQISDVTSSGSAVFQDGDGSGPSGIARYSNLYNGTTGYGMVTEFDYSAGSFGFVTIPEPRTLILFGYGLAGVFAIRRRRHS
jgi:hypothetical protein